MSEYFEYQGRRFVLDETPSLELCRVPHDVERVRVYVKEGETPDYRYRGGHSGSVRRSVIEKRDALPEVYRVYPDHTTPIREGHQWMWRGINPELSGDKWARLLGNSLAWTNGTGFPGHKDYVNRRDLDKELPRFHAPLLCGGAIVEGRRDGTRFLIHSILTSDPAPSGGALLKMPRLWYYGTSVNPAGEIHVIRKLGMDGEYKDVRIPILTTQPIWLPYDELHHLTPGQALPHPTWISS